MNAWMNEVFFFLLAYMNWYMSFCVLWCSVLVFLLLLFNINYLLLYVLFSYGPHSNVVLLSQVLLSRQQLKCHFDACHHLKLYGDDELCNEMTRKIEKVSINLFRRIWLKRWGKELKKDYLKSNNVHFIT